MGIFDMFKGKQQAALDEPEFIQYDSVSPPPPEEAQARLPISTNVVRVTTPSDPNGYRLDPNMWNIETWEPELGNFTLVPAQDALGTDGLRFVVDQAIKPAGAMVNKADSKSMTEFNMQGILQMQATGHIFTPTGTFAVYFTTAGGQQLEFMCVDVTDNVAGTEHYSRYAVREVRGAYIQLNLSAPKAQWDEALWQQVVSTVRIDGSYRAIV